MPRFHLHVRTPSKFIEDEEGSYFSDYSAAIVEAVKGARCLMKGEIAGGTLCLDQSIEICNAEGQHVTTVLFTEALKLIPQPEQMRRIGTVDGTGP